MRTLGLVVLIGCTSSSSAPAPVTPTATSNASLAMTSRRRVVLGDDPVWCIIDRKYPDLGDCSSTATDCNWAYKEALRAGHDTSECTRRTRAACFDSTRIMMDRRDRSCAPSITQCEMTLSETRKNPDDEVHDKECYVYRVRLPDELSP